MTNRRQAHSSRVTESARLACEAEMGLGAFPDRRFTAGEANVPGSTEEANPLMERALRALHVAEQVRFGWV
ncbi:MAG: hypothetical protein KJ060_13615 [Candidatus Hydrogenedentes bacterium]|nr:hypothetical protein [Candidatus Hydrogenedentota bacterium]